ncbi:MAG: glycerate kinase [Desulfobacterales bacterium]|nr:glycerate kinase [Desulfobacterales bacterium]
MTPHRKDLMQIFNAALDAVRPDRALIRHLKIENNILMAGEQHLDLDEIDQIIVVGAGKGAAPMAAALEEILGDRISQGKVCVKYDHTVPTQRIELVEAAHPVPDGAGEAAAHGMLDLVAQAGERDLVICLITGGASALTPATVEGITLEQVQTMTRKLMAWGADIHEINTLRKHFSSFGGGQLAAAAMPARVISFIISDVIGDDLDVIASGPTTPDRSSYQDGLDILDKYRGKDQLPAPLVRHLEEGRNGRLPETPKPDHPAFARVTNILAATNAQALEAAAAKARDLGYATEILTATMDGEARERARELVETARKIHHNSHVQTPVCLLAGGETTVTLKGRGKGGRNQEMALAAANHLIPGEDITLLCMGTDGSDGPTDAAGGFACPETLKAIQTNGLNPNHFLDQNNAYEFLHRTQSLVKTGPTLTNVMDLVLILIPQGNH